MVELNREQRQIIDSLCRDSREVLVQGVAENAMGRVWVPALSNPAYCLLQLGDFSYLIGIPPKAAMSLELREAIEDHCDHGFIIPREEWWKGWMDENFAGEYRQSSRYAMRRGTDYFDRERLLGYAKRLPDKIRIRMIDERLYHLALKEPWSVDFCSNFESPEAFLTEGLGFVAMDGRKIVAGCSAYGRGHDKIAVQVETKEDYRGRGLALACSARFILECLERGIDPDWDAANLQSVGLAEKLGYVFDREYEVFELMQDDVEKVG